MTATTSSIDPGTRAGLAVFDFDGTLTDRHTFWRYLRFLVGAERFRASLFELAPTAASVVLGRVPVMDGRAELVSALLAGLDASHEARCADEFAQQHVPPWLRPAAIARLRVHQARGHRTVLLSNSAESYLRHVGAALGFDLVLGTRLEVREGRLTGRIEGRSCVGPEKVRRLREAVGPLREHDIHAYGDSQGDRELLSVADHPSYRPFRI